MLSTADRELRAVDICLLSKCEGCLQPQVVENSEWTGDCVHLFNCDMKRNLDSGG